MKVIYIYISSVLEDIGSRIAKCIASHAAKNKYVACNDFLVAAKDLKKVA